MQRIFRSSIELTNWRILLSNYLTKPACDDSNTLRIVFCNIFFDVLYHYQVFRSSYRRCFVKKVFLEILQNSLENTCVRAILLKNRPLHRFFFCKFCEISKSTFSYRTSSVAAFVYFDIFAKFCEGEYVLEIQIPITWSLLHFLYLCKQMAIKSTHVFARFGILELRNRITKPSYTKWCHTSSY